MSTSVSLFIIILTAANIFACLWVMWWAGRRRQGSGDEHEAHVWDGDLSELNNPLPRWWLWLFILTIVFSLAYLIAFPGFGNFPGMLQWNQAKEHAAETRAAQSRLEAHLAGLQSSSIQELAANQNAMATARNLFGLYCSTCHGSDARGAKGFPNLTDNDWLWGNATETIYQTIAQGRVGVMPAWGAALGNGGVQEVSAYVLSLSGRKVPQDWAEAGKARFAAMCAACHGPDGKGNQLLGAPNLTDQTWLYGGSLEAVQETIANGRNNQMPAHEEFLGATKTKLMAAYVLSLSAQSSAAGGQH